MNTETENFNNNELEKLRVVQRLSSLRLVNDSMREKITLAESEVGQTLTALQFPSDNFSRIFSIQATLESAKKLHSDLVNYINKLKTTVQNQDPAEIQNEIRNAVLEFETRNNKMREHVERLENLLKEEIEKPENKIVG